MSIESWKAEFYPRPADEIDKSEAVEHTLRKWKGARPENLAKHGVTKNLSSLLQGGKKETFFFFFDTNTCALCAFYECKDCPLFHQTTRECYNENSEYKHWCDTGDPEPMIEALEAIKPFSDNRWRYQQPDCAESTAEQISFCAAVQYLSLRTTQEKQRHQELFTGTH